jgi:hypothetical protein
MKQAASKLRVAWVLALATAAVPTISHADGAPKPNKFWWPDQLDLSPLRAHAGASNPLGDDFDYAKAFATLDIAAVKKDIKRSSPRRKIGGQPTLATTVHSSSAWPGTARARTARAMAEAAPTVVSFASIPRTAGPTTRTSTRRVVCCGP